MTIALEIENSRGGVSVCCCETVVVVCHEHDVILHFFSTRAEF